jgi:hypothetical protein
MNANAMIAPTSLEEVLAYRHAGVIRRYRTEHNATQQEAEELFREMLKWLYLCYRASTVDFACAISPELGKIDWMWHTFLLFTRDYADFCDRHFDAFIHHVPEDEEAATPEDEIDVRERLARQFELVYDLLGEETLSAWHDECRYAVPA